MNKLDRTAFLPVSKEDMAVRGIEQLDFVYISGDAYVDHPSFGTAIISRILEANGFTVGIIAQPNWRDPKSVCTLGEPKLGFLVSAGNMDSMVNHYTVAKKHRQKDSYSPGGKMGLRPDRAVIVYSNLIRQTFKKTPVILGGIEASLRRMAHYDYWENKVKHSILIDSGADLISYGMGEHSIIEIAESLESGIPVEEITYIAGTVFKCKDLDRVYEPIVLPSYEEVKEQVWVHKSANVFESAYIGAPCIIGPETEVRHGAFIRGSALVGANCVVGNSVELKNVILFDNVQVPHYNYVGDSILGYKSHMGAGSITSNVKSDKKLVVIKTNSEQIETGLKKIGAMLGDYVEVGCNSVLNPGTIIGKCSNVYPTSCVRGVIPENSIFKNSGVVIQKD